MTHTRKQSLIAIALWLLTAPVVIAAADPATAWDSRCDQCHGKPDEFAGKYLWAINGKLQGLHHVHDLRRFLSNHYAPAHLIDGIQVLLAKHANTAARFDSECGSCHGRVEDFASASIEFRWRKVRGVKSGMALEEYLATHQDLGAENAEFFALLLGRFVEQNE